MGERDVTAREFTTLSLTERDLVELFLLVARSKASNGLGNVYAALGEQVRDPLGLTPGNVNYTRPAIFDAALPLHGPLAETPDSEIHDYGDHPDYPDDQRNLSALPLVSTLNSARPSHAYTDDKEAPRSWSCRGRDTEGVIFDA